MIVQNEPNEIPKHPNSKIPKPVSKNTKPTLSEPQVLTSYDSPTKKHTEGDDYVA